MQLDVVLKEPAISGNVGAVARTMKNFGFENLVLINPECDHLDYEGKARAMHAKDDVLDSARVEDENYLERYDYLVATTAIIGGDYNIKRSPVAPEELGERLAEVENDVRVGILFGTEDQGLSNKEIMKCDYVCTIPTHTEYPTMNLSHSAAVILYEVFKASDRKDITEDINAVGEEEKEILLEKIDAAIDNVEWQNDHRKEMQRFLWRRVLGRAMLTNREAHALMGFFKEFNR